MQWLVGALVTPILNFFWNKIAAAIEKWRAYQQKKDAAKLKNKQVFDQTVAAKTKEERDEAAKNAINKF